MEKQKGFTLIELLIVIVIIGILATVGIPIFSGYFEKARFANATAELSGIHKAIQILEMDTGLSPGGLTPPSVQCVHNQEIDLDDCGAGLLCNDGTFSNWNGPYIDISMEDPWGTVYQFDPDYHCSNGQLGCEDHAGDIIRAIVSAGPDGLFNYDVNELVFVLCE